MTQLDRALKVMGLFYFKTGLRRIAAKWYYSCLR